MKTTVVMNLKGGVGKTTTVINLAYLLATAWNERVLVIDADSQCNLTEFFGADPEEGNLAEVLRGGSADLAILDIVGTEYPHLNILPGDDSLMDLDLSKVAGKQVHVDVLRRLVDELTVRDTYDYVLIDCPPAFNAACAAALMAADDVIIPIKLDAFSLRGMGNLARQIANMRRVNPRLRISGCLPTMWYKSEQIAAAERELRNAGLHLFHHVRRSDRVDDMTFAQEPLGISSPNSGAGIDYRLVAAEISGRKAK